MRKSVIVDNLVDDLLNKKYKLTYFDIEYINLMLSNIKNLFSLYKMKSISEEEYISSIDFATNRITNFIFEKCEE